MRSKEYELIISERAVSMLSSHIAFIAQVNRNAAVELKKDIIKGIKEIENMPEKYPWLINELLPINKYHKKIIKNRYIIIYQIKGNKIYVDYIIDGRQDYNWLLK